MKALRLNAVALVGVISSIVPFASNGSAHDSAGGSTSQYAALLLSASVAPLHYLSGAQIIVKNNRGKVVARGETNIDGVTLVRVPGNRMSNMPLRISTYGGKIHSQYPSESEGVRFKGHLKGEINTAPLGESTLVDLDLVSTIASKLESKLLSYKAAFDMTRMALGIRLDAPVNVLRYGDRYVDWATIDKEIAQRRGYGRFIKSIANQVRLGHGVSDLKPSSVSGRSNSSGDNGEDLVQAKKALNAMTSDTTYNPCDSPIGNTNANGGSGSTEKIVAVGLESTQLLLTMAGQKNLAEGVGIVSGMLMRDGKSGSSPTADAIDNVQKQLVCISQQLEYLDTQLKELALVTAVNTSADCTATVATEYYKYQRFVEDAQPKSDGSPSDYPLSSKNLDFVNTLNGWGPQGTASISSCGKVINNSLFGHDGGQSSSWQKLNINYQSAYKWYSMTQVQELQQYLAWWSMMLYDTFILTNEYNNYYEYYQSARYASGSYEYSSTLCEPGSTSDTPTFCVVQNNILSAYPGDLYSDEIGVPLSGLGITVFPGARVLPSPVSTDPWPVLDTKYMVQNFGLRNKTAWVLASVYDDIATAWEESMPENPYAVNSTMETYWSPLVRHYSATQDQVAILAQPGPPGPWSAGAESSAAEFFHYHVNQYSKSPWKSLETKYLSFYTSENQSKMQFDGINYWLDLYSSYMSPKAFTAGFFCSGKNNGVCDYYDPIYTMGILRQRTWWLGAGSAASYDPPRPPQP